MSHHVQVVKTSGEFNRVDTHLTGVEWDVTDRNALVIFDKRGQVVASYAQDEWESATTVGLEITETNDGKPRKIY